MLLLSVFKAASLDGRQPGWPYGLSGSRPLRDLLLQILYASLENKFFFFFFLSNGLDHSSVIENKELNKWLLL